MAEFGIELVWHHCDVHVVRKAVQGTGADLSIEGTEPDATASICVVSGTEVAARRRMDRIVETLGLSPREYTDGHGS